MAITLTVLQANGNPSRSAMALLHFDGAATVPSGANLNITAAVLDAAGGNVNASATITTTTAAITDVHVFAETFLAALQASRTGTFVWVSKNTDQEWVYHFEPKHDLAQTVNLSAASYSAT